MHVFYEAVGYMVSAQADAPTRDALLMKLMEWPNQVTALHTELGRGGVNHRREGTARAHQSTRGRWPPRLQGVGRAEQQH